MRTFPRQNSGAKAQQWEVIGQAPSNAQGIQVELERWWDPGGRASELNRKSKTTHSNFPYHHTHNRVPPAVLIVLNTVAWLLHLRGGTVSGQGALYSTKRQARAGGEKGKLMPHRQGVKTSTSVHEPHWASPRQGQVTKMPTTLLPLGMYRSRFPKPGSRGFLIHCPSAETNTVAKCQGDMQQGKVFSSFQWWTCHVPSMGKKIDPHLEPDQVDMEVVRVISWMKLVEVKEIGQQ